VSSKNSDGILTLKSFIEEKSEEIISFELQKHIYNINIILIGPTYVGKSSLIERIINNTFNFNSHEPTGGPDIKQVKVDLKNHSSINYKYIDVSGQERYISTWISFLDKADIIIFVNNKDELKVNISNIEERVLLSDKKIICCINKKDLFSDGENREALKQFKIINNKLKDKQIILVSALTSSGIRELKNKIKEYSINIIEEKKNKSQSKKIDFTTERLINKSFELDPSTNKKEKCCSYL
jgi:small GTP-binding protein